MRTLQLFLLMLIAFLSTAQENPWKGNSVDFKHGKLKVSDNKRFIIFEDGTPFFYLGDTGWELFHRLTIEETEKYLENRRQKGFTVIQAVVLAELDGLNTPNMYNEIPLIDNDPLKPNEKYFQHVDKVIKLAESKGIFIGLLPTWGDKVDKASWGTGPVIFNEENAGKYAAWLANRYKSFPNIIWINGGDRSGGDKNFPIWESIGKSLRANDSNHLITFHPWGGKSSSEWFHDSKWLDFNMCQSGHGERSYSIYKRIITEDYAKKNTKPCFDGEPRYEDHPVAWNPNILGWFDDADVRQAAYWSLFTGSFGHTYGCHPIWQMMAPGREPIGYARHNWTEVLDLPGAFDLIHIRRLMESRPFLSRVPASELIINQYVPETDFIVATKGDGYAMVYIPTGWAAEINLDLMKCEKLQIWWFDPRTGISEKGEIIPAKGKKEFTPSKSGRGNDFILVMDDVSKKYGIPGAF